MTEDELPDEDADAPPEDDGDDGESDGGSGLVSRFVRSMRGLRTRSALLGTDDPDDDPDDDVDLEGGSPR